MTYVGSYCKEISMPLENRSFHPEDAKRYSRGPHKHPNDGKDRYYGGLFGSKNHQSTKVFSHTDKGSMIDENNKLVGKQVTDVNKRVVETMVPVNMSSNGINTE